MMFKDFKKALKQKFQDNVYFADVKYTSDDRLDKKTIKYNECGFNFESDVNSCMKIKGDVIR